MRDSAATEIGDQPVASNPAIGAAVSQASEETGGRLVSEGAMFGSAAGRGRRSLWAILSLLFALGVAVSTVVVNSERNDALDVAVRRARDEARLAKATLTDRQLTKPVTGSRYDELAAEIQTSVSPSGSIAGLTVWSARGRILFSLDESLVGTTPSEMQSLITEAKGSGLTRVVDDTVQTFTPVSKGADGPVAIVQVDQSLAVVEAQSGNLWSLVRLGSAFGMVVSLLFLGLTFVPTRRLGRAREHKEGPGHGERHEGDAGTEMTAGGRPEEPPTAASVPTYEEVFGPSDELDQAVEAEGDLDGEALEGDPEAAEGHPGAAEADSEAAEADPEAAEADPEAREADPEAVESIRRWDEAYENQVNEELQTQELMRQRREEFKARAEAAALRAKKQEAELQEARPTPE